MRRRSFLPLFIALALTGCNVFSSHPNVPLVADAWSPIKDVPVPAGFNQAGDSRANVAPGPGGQRIVDHHYTGPDDVFPIAAFYKEQLPKYGWKLDNTDQVSGKEVVLRFSKEKGKPETCAVTVTARTFDTSIRIRISPAPAAAAATTRP